MARMRAIFQGEWLNRSVVFFAVLLLLSLSVSPFLLSISMWGLVFTAYFNSARDAVAEGRISDMGKARSWWGALAYSFERWFARPELWCFSLLFLVVLLNGVYSDDLQKWLNWTRVRLPFFVLPWAFANLPRLSRQQLELPMLFFAYGLVLIGLGVGVNFFLHYDEIMAGIRMGQPIPVPRNHIRFSLSVVVAIIVLAAFLWARASSWSRRKKLALWLVFVFLVLLVHLLSVRSALVALYAAVLYTVFHLIVYAGRQKVAALLVVVMVVVMAGSYYSMPSLQKKLDYMQHDWEQYQLGNTANYSDAGRWISLRLGLDVWERHPWLGVGAGDLHRAMQQAHDDRFPELAGKEPKLPHNQFLFVLAGSGLLGLAASLFGLYLPFGFRRYRADYLYVVFQVIAFTSFLVEYTIETAIGVALYLFFTLWFMKMADDGAG